MSPSISDAKCVLVIGATSGIGRALALAIHALPHNPTVIVGGRRQERLDELIAKDPQRIKAIRIDTTSPRDTLKAFVSDIINAYPLVIRDILLPYFL